MEVQPININQGVDCAIEKKHHCMLFDQIGIIKALLMDQCGNNNVYTVEQKCFDSKAKPTQ